ncbi:MAG TPA: deoxyribose-phosphate aldolase [Bacteroidales bacterium]
MTSLLELSKLIDHSILQPTYTDEDLRKECAISNKYQTATVCVKPYHTAMAAQLVKGTGVGVCAVIGFPAGNSPISTKVFETEYVCREGATEVDMVVNVGKVLSEDWDYIDAELKAVHAGCKKYKAILKVIFETDYITKAEHKIKLCELCSKHNIEYVKTSTGYGFVKGNDGKYSYVGATLEDIALFKKHCSSSVKIKAAGGIRSLDEFIKFKDAGVARIGASATISILEEAKKRVGL